MPGVQDGEQNGHPDYSAAIDQLKKRNAAKTTYEGRLKAYNLKAKPTDVFLVTPQKCGTTWAQQIIHGLRTRGSMDFEEICLVFPHIEYAHDYGYTDLDAPQVAEPRCFKTHNWQPYVAKGGKYVCVFRDPLDVGPSCYHFLGEWVFKKEDIPLDVFIREIFISRPDPKNIHDNAGYWSILNSWYPYRNDPSVLWLHYEDMLQDLPAAVNLIAKHIGVGGDDPELQAIATKQASLDFMKAHASQFDEHHFKVARNEAIGLPKDAGLGAGSSAKVRAGGAGKTKLSEESKQAILDKWRSTVQPVTGYATYKEMREGINKELGRPFFLTPAAA